MKAAKRYLLLLLAFILVFVLWLTLPWNWTTSDGVGRRRESEKPKRNFPSRPFSDVEDAADDVDSHISPMRRLEVAAIVKKRNLCRMETCFDVEKCRAIPDYKVYVYPVQDRLSPSYAKILSSIRDSRFYTPDPKLACLFILAIDTLDRDIGSADFVKNMQQKVNSLPTWNNGRNHIIFNLYSGTWPDYNEDLGFDFGEAILAKASFSVLNFRYGFDISLPLFPKDHPLKGGDLAIPNSPNVFVSPLFPALRKYTLVFKGKRYLSGIGSESRNSLYHLHNEKDVILLTTCKHGKQWKNMKDERCDVDNSQYDKFDYQTLLHNSTFCLVPRGRRLGSFRFLEALQAGCIPVLLSNGWVLPFSEVIDWNRAAIWADERLIFQVPSIVRSLTLNRILAMRRQTLFLWSAYFASVEKIALTTIETVKDRIFRQTSHQKHHWNMRPGGLHILPDFSDDLKSFPFYHEYHHHHRGHDISDSSFLSPHDHASIQNSNPLTSNDLPSSLSPRDAKFTAIILARSTQSLSTGQRPGVNNSPHILDPRSSLFKLIKNVQSSDFCEKILILWPGSKSPRLPPSVVPIVVITDVRSVNSRFYPYAHLQTSAVLSLDDDVALSTEEIDFAFRVWTQFPDRIVGFSPRNHFWDESRSRWSYTSKWANQYSMILTHAAFYHRYFHYLYTHSLRSSHVEIVESSQSCEDMLMNFIVSHVTRLPPIKVTQRKSLKDSPSSSPFSASSSHVAFSSSSAYNETSFAVKQACLNDFVSSFGYMPLIRSSLRFDPVLFKDQVSTLRKKYKVMESMGP